MASSTTATATLSTSQSWAQQKLTKRRAARACDRCRAKKVRCDVLDRGRTCTNCLLDKTPCQLHARAPPREQVQRVMNAATGAQAGTSALPNVAAPSLNAFEGMAINANIDSTLDNVAIQDNVSMTNDDFNLFLEFSAPTPQIQNESCGPDTCSNRDANAQSSHLRPRAESTSGEVHPLNLPGKAGQPVQLPNFIKPLPHIASPVDLDYLMKKGAFSIPAPKLRNELLRSYYLFVHPLIPHTDIKYLLEAVSEGHGEKRVSLLLFQAVMFSATPFVDEKLLEEAGFRSRGEARYEFYGRMQSLYSANIETDRLAITQATLLLSYWYERLDDPQDLWHWSGVAISFATSIAVDDVPSSAAVDPATRRLWRRLWWSCYVRDRLIATGTRMPMRINEDDFRMPDLVLDDFDLAPLSVDICNMLGGGPDDAASFSSTQNFAECFIALTRLCRLLSSVLLQRYDLAGAHSGTTCEAALRLRPKAKLNATTIVRLDRVLRSWYGEQPERLRFSTRRSQPSASPDTVSPVVYLHQTVLKCIYYTTVNTLHRPQIMSNTEACDHQLRDLASIRLYEAVKNVTKLFRQLQGFGLTPYLPITATTILFPTIIAQSNFSKSHDRTLRAISISSVHFLLQVLNQMSKVYQVASAVLDFVFTVVCREVPSLRNAFETLDVNPLPIPHIAQQVLASNTLTSQEREVLRFLSAQSPRLGGPDSDAESIPSLPSDLDPDEENANDPVATTLSNGAHNSSISNPIPTSGVRRDDMLSDSPNSVGGGNSIVTHSLPSPMLVTSTADMPDLPNFMLGDICDDRPHDLRNFNLSQSALSQQGTRS